MNGLFKLRDFIYSTLINTIAVKENQRDHQSDNDSGSDASSVLS